MRYLGSLTSFCIDCRVNCCLGYWLCFNVLCGWDTDCSTFNQLETKTLLIVKYYSYLAGHHYLWKRAKDLGKQHGVIFMIIRPAQFLSLAKPYSLTKITIYMRAWFTDCIIITKSQYFNNNIDIWIYKLLLIYLLLIGPGNLLKHINIVLMLIEVVEVSSNTKFSIYLFLKVLS